MGGVITNTVQDRGARCRSSVVPPLPDGDGGVTDRATTPLSLDSSSTPSTPGLDTSTPGLRAYKKGRGQRRDAGEDEAETSADESRADPGTGEPEQTASAAEGTLGRGTRRAATSTDYGGPVARRRRADDGEAEQTRRARRGREQDVAEISRRMYDEIRSSRDPRDHVEDG